MFEGTENDPEIRRMVAVVVADVDGAGVLVAVEVLVELPQAVAARATASSDAA